MSDDPSINIYLQFMNLIEQALDPQDIILAHS